MANLWYAAAKALGFKVSLIRCPDPLFLGSIKGFEGESQKFGVAPAAITTASPSP